MMRSLAVRWVVSVPVLAVTAFPLACGYRLAGTTLQVPGNVRSVSVGEFQNRSREEGLDKVLAFALERELYERGTVRVAEDPAAGEAILTGTIREFRTRPVSYDADDNALQYEARLSLDITLRRQSDGQVLWKGSRLQAIEEFSVNRDTVVPSSSQFQRGTLDFSNLSDLSDIQLAETQKRLAIQRLVRSIVRDVRERMMDDF